MRESTYHVLAALMDGPQYGYAIIKHVETASGGRVRLAIGTLYSALERLSADDLVTVVNEEIVNGRARRYYALTETGAAALRAEALRMATASRMVTDRGFGAAAASRVDPA
jgi:PadR family transcriptional regulator, regulatory protein PadR